MRDLTADRMLRARGEDIMGLRLTDIRKEQGESVYTDGYRNLAASYSLHGMIVMSAGDI